MTTDYYTEQIENLIDGARIIDYLVLLKKLSSLEFILELMERQVVLALDDSDKLHFVGVRASGKFQLVPHTEKVTISSHNENLTAVKIDSDSEWSGIYRVIRKCKLGQYADARELLNKIIDKVE